VVLAVFGCSFAILWCVSRVSVLVGISASAHNPYRPNFRSGHTAHGVIAPDDVWYAWLSILTIQVPDLSPIEANLQGDRSNLLFPVVCIMVVLTVSCAFLCAASVYFCADVRKFRRGVFLSDPPSSRLFVSVDARRGCFWRALVPLSFGAILCMVWLWVFRFVFAFTQSRRAWNRNCSSLPVVTFDGPGGLGLCYASFPLIPVIRHGGWCALRSIGNFFLVVVWPVSL